MAPEKAFELSFKRQHHINFIQLSTTQNYKNWRICLLSDIKQWDQISVQFLLPFLLCFLWASYSIQPSQGRRGNGGELFDHGRGKRMQEGVWTLQRPFYDLLLINLRCSKVFWLTVLTWQFLLPTFDILAWLLSQVWHSWAGWWMFCAPFFCGVPRHSSSIRRKVFGFLFTIEIKFIPFHSSMWYFLVIFDAVDWDIYRNTSIAKNKNN